MTEHREALADNASALALLLVPEHNSMTAGQVRGADCAWCEKPLTAESAVDLPERRVKRLDGDYNTFPRGCRACVGTEALRALFRHADKCSHCRRHATGCDAGDGLRRLMREGRIRA